MILCYNKIKAIRRLFMIRIIVVEDDENLNLSVCRYLSGCGYEVSGALNGADALRLMENKKFDMIVSDIMMPLMDGFEFAEAVRAVDKSIPILFMTAKDDLDSKERGFKAGIDDYLVKPFDLAELKMRVAALLRRAKIAQTQKIEIGDFIIDEDEHTAFYRGEEIQLTVKEFSVLFKLLSFPRKTFSRAALMDEFWGYDSMSSSRAIDVCIAELRKKVARVEEFEILTVHGLGYKAVLK